MRTPHPTTDAPTRDMVRAALIELLTAGTFGAATPATLHAIGATRTTLAQHTGRNHPVAPYAPIPDYKELRAGLATLAAVALAWLDALHHPDTDPGDDEDEGYHECADPQPF